MGMQLQEIAKLIEEKRGPGSTVAVLRKPLRLSCASKRRVESTYVPRFGKSPERSVPPSRN
jgi:hypothetical protein